jgi:hypothetical protein
MMLLLLAPMSAVSSDSPLDVYTNCLQDTLAQSLQQGLSKVEAKAEALSVCQSQHDVLASSIPARYMADIDQRVGAALDR